VLVVDTVDELVIMEVDVVVTVVERLVVDVGEKVVVVCSGGVLTLARPKIPLAGALDTTRTPTSERKSTILRTVKRRVFFLLLM
jgi:hypothetical protein